MKAASVGFGVVALPLIYVLSVGPTPGVKLAASPVAQSGTDLVPPTVEAEAQTQFIDCPRLPPSQPHLPPADNPGDPDYLPFAMTSLNQRDPAGRVRSLLHKQTATIGTGLTLAPAYFKLPPVPPAPTGEEAMKLAREQGWPDHWRARMRPRHFILGPMKTGTTTMYWCYRRAMIGDPRKRVYPLATERWPIRRDRNGQAVIQPSHMIPEPFTVWNRTGARRLDLRKEWRVYHLASWTKQETPGLEQYHYLRFPPVEKETKDWTMLDATPHSLMIPGAADLVKEDLRCAPFKPRFVVMNRDALSRGYSQFVMEDTLWKQVRRGKNYFDELEYQSKQGSMGKHEICKMMMNEPEALIKDIRLVRLALQTCIFFDSPLYTDVDLLKRKLKKQQYVVNLFQFGFTALGLKYWLHVFDYDTSLFRVVDTNSLKAIDADQMMGVVENLFDMKRMLPRCQTAVSDDPTCTPWNQYDPASKECGWKLNSWSGKADFTMGDPVKLQKYQKISDRWGKIMNDLIVEYNITRVKPPPRKAHPRP